MQNYNINYYNSIDNISENSQHIMEEIILTPWNALNDAQQNYVVNQLKKCGMYSVYENVRISKTTDALKSMDSALYYIFRENDKFVKIAMGQPEGFFFSDEKTAEKILQRIFEHPQFDKSLWTSRKYRKELKANGIKFLYYHDPFSILWTRFVNYRNHRKIVVVDGVVAYMGGMNMGQEYIDGGKRFNSWKDVHMRIVGDSCNLIQNVFVCDWYNAGGRDLEIFNIEENKHKHFKKIKYADKNLNEEKVSIIRKDLFPQSFTDKFLPVQIITSGADSKWDSIQKVYSKMIEEAKESIYIESPYFVPDDGFLRTLENAALSEVNVNLMITGNPDKLVAWWVAQTYFETLLNAGVNIYLYEKGFLHSKFCVMDGRIVSCGTCNMDIRSFYLHYEMNAVIYDIDIAKKFEDIFKKDMLDSHKITIEEYSKQPMLVRLRNSACRIIAPVL